ncbi:MAG: glycyl-radical enzyme activating protein [Peptococcaceae bacterium]
MTGINGYLMEPQNFSVNDGNGIRTIIFLAGCPLSCQWCANPEGQTDSPKVAYYRRTCLSCGKCVRVCPNGVGIDLNNPGERQNCKSCGLCVKFCPTNSRKKLVYCSTSEEILEIIERQRIFYRYSGGGVTFSGGEATLQADLLRELVFKLYDKAIDLALETSGYFNFTAIKDILEKLNLIFVDIKHMDDSKHREYTGVGNKMILQNISRFKELKVPVVVRIPVIGGVNSNTENISKTARFVKANLADPQIELLPYHLFGESKYEALGLLKPSNRFKAPEPEYLRSLQRIVENEGVKVVNYK